MGTFSKIILPITLLIVSANCSDDQFLYLDEINQISEVQEPDTRSGKSFDDDWENMTEVILPSGKKIMLPWDYSADSPAHFDIRKDVKKEDGWVMLNYLINREDYHNMPLLFIALYNKASGDIKVFLYADETPTAHNNALWTVYFTKPQGWMNSLNEVSLPTNYKFKSDFLWETSVSPIKGKSYIEKGWNVIIIPCLAYDPSVPDTIGIQIGSKAYSITLVDLLGETNGEIDGKIITVGTKNPLTGLQNSLVSYSGKSAQNWAEKVLKIKDNNDPRGIPVIAAAGVGALVKAGAGKILNNLLGWFSKPTYSEQNVRFSIQTTAAIKGKLITQMSTGLPSTGFAIGKDVTGIELGTWNLTANPIIYIHPVGVMYKSFNGTQSDEAQYRFTASGKSKIDIVVNPQLLPHVIKYETECVSVAYSTGNDTSKLPQIPVSDYSYTDFGSLGREEMTVAYVPYLPENSLIYSGEDFSIYDNNAQGVSTFWRIWDKFGKYSPNMPLYKYIYAPDNMDLCRGGEIKVGCKYYFAKVIVTMVTEFEGKRDTIVTSRTYKPRFEWDPDEINKYCGMNMVLMQSLASRDAILSKIDNGYYESLLRAGSTYNIVKNDSLVIE